MDPVKIKANGQVMAYVFPRTLGAPEGIRFLNDAADPLQVGLMERPAGHYVQPHMHPPCERKTHMTPEFFFVQSGRIRVTIYDKKWKEIARHELQSGDSMLILDGGHEVEILEATRMFEVKLGPYLGDENAKVFRTNV